MNDNKQLEFPFMRNWNFGVTGVEKIKSPYPIKTIKNSEGKK